MRARSASSETEREGEKNKTSGRTCFEESERKIFPNRNQGYQELCVCERDRVEEREKASERERKTTCMYACVRMCTRVCVCAFVCVWTLPQKPN